MASEQGALSGVAVRDNPLLQVVALGSMWGSSFVCIKWSLASFSPLEIAFGRLAIAAVVLQLMLARAGRKEPRGAAPPTTPLLWLLLFAMAMLANIIPATLIGWGLTSLPSSAAAIANATTPLFTAVLAVAFAREPRPSLSRIVGIAIAFLGVALMFGFGFGGGTALAGLSLLVAAFSYACAFIVASAKPFRGRSLVWLSASQMKVATVTLLPVALVNAAVDPPAPRLGAIAALAALGLIATGFATIYYLRTVRLFGPTIASLATYVVPVVGTALGVVCLGDTLGPFEVAGALLVGVGIIFAERARQRPTSSSERLAEG